MIPSYGKIYSVGHRDLHRLFDGEVTVQEKIDGSQFSAMKDGQGELHCRSKNEPIDLGSPQKLFGPAVHYLQSARHYMISGWIYRFETLNRPKHNVLTYERVPKGNLVLIDCWDGFDNVDLCYVAEQLDVEPVQQLFRGRCSEADLPSFLEAKPMLGGSMIEGIVIKNYVLGLKAKHVAPRFQEIASSRPARAPKESIVEQLGRKYCSEARWEKAIAHLRDSGTLTESVSDIGPLIKEIQRDVLEECGADIREELFNHYAKDLRNAWISGFPEWYKRRAFER